MHVSVTFDLNNPKHAEAFDRLRATVPGVGKTAKVSSNGGDSAETTPTAPQAEPKKRGRPPGTAKKAVEVKAVSEVKKADDEDDADLGDDDEDEEGELAEDDEEEAGDDDLIDDDEKKKLQSALRKFADAKGENGKSAAVKLLKKFAPATSKVKRSDLPKLLKALKVA